MEIGSPIAKVTHKAKQPRRFAVMCYPQSTMRHLPVSWCGWLLVGVMGCSEAPRAAAPSRTVVDAETEEAPPAPAAPREREQLADGIPAPYALALSGESVYVASARTANATDIWRVPTSGGAPAKVVENQQPVTLAADTNGVYWFSKAELKSLGPGDQPKTIGTTPSGVSAMALGPAHVYWSGDDGVLRRVSRGGGATETVVTTDSNCGLSAVAADAEFVFWVHRTCGDLQRAPAQGGPGTQLALLAGSRSPVVALAGAHVIWGLGGALSRVGKDGSSPTTLVGDDNDVRSMATDERAIYWLRGNATLATMPATGGDVTELFAGLRAPRELRTDATHVYWLEGADGQPGSVVRMRK